MSGRFIRHGSRLGSKIRGTICVLGLLALAGCREQEAPRLNLILVTVDTLRKDALGLAGNPDAHTPNLDRVARQAVFCQGATSASVFTNPAMASIFSGRPCRDHGVYDNTHPLPDNFPTLAEELSLKGYRTLAAVSAFQLNPKHSGLGRGFDSFLECMPENQRAASETNRRLFEALDSSESSEPLFLWVHYFEPHSPYEPPRPYDGLARYPFRFDDTLSSDEAFLPVGDEAEKRYGWVGQRSPREIRALYGGEVAAVDSALGSLFADLQDRRILQDSLIIVHGDHGESLTEHGIYYFHHALYGTTAMPPLLLWLPGKEPDQPVRNDLISFANLGRRLPELMDRVPTRGLERTLSLLANPEVVSEDAHGYSISLRQDRYHLILHRSNSYFYPHHPYFQGHMELYDLQADPGETTNLRFEMEERADSLRDDLDRWINQP